MRKLTEVLEARRLEASKSQVGTSQQLIHFVGQGVRADNINIRCDWNLRVELDWQFKFPTEITTTSLLPDIILWSTST